jgi:hypothetical protein
MSGLTDLLSRVNLRTDEFLRNTSGGSPVAAEFRRDGRFNLAGLITLLSLGAPDVHALPNEPMDLSTLDATAVRAALDRVDSPVTAEEAGQVLELLKSGAITADVASALHATLRLARRLPPDLVIDVLRLPELPVDVIQAVSEDLAGATQQREPRQVLVDLRDGRINRAILSRTLGVLLNRAATKNVAETIRALIGPENRTIRLAILMYARTQGIKLKEDDLDALYQGIDPASPDLSPLLNRGLEQLTTRLQGAGDAVAVLRRLRA